MAEATAAAVRTRAARCRQQSLRVVALRHLSLTLFYILVFTSPLLVATLGRLFLKEPMDWRKVMAILTGFLSVVFAVYPARYSGSNAWIDVGACAVCGTCFLIATVWARIISQTERAESMTFFSGLVSAAVGLCAMIFYSAPVGGRLLLAFVATGLLGAVGNICMFTALKHTTAATVSQYHYTQLVSGSVVAWFLFHEEPTAWMLAGASVIVAAGLYVAVRKPVAEVSVQLEHS